MKKATCRIGLAVVVLGLVAAAAPAKADFQWNFSYDFPTYDSNFNPGPYVTASGMLTTTDVLNGDGSYTITAITGTRTFNGTTDTITGLLAPNDYQGNDNELFSTAPLININGFSFTINGAHNGNRGTNKVNVYHDQDGYWENDSSVEHGTFSAVRAVRAVPEPTTLLMTGTGILMILGHTWRRRRAMTNA